MKVVVGIGEGSVTGAENMVSSECFTTREAADLADWLEGLNTPNNHGTPVRRLTDMLWALQNDTDAFIVFTKEG